MNEHSEDCIHGEMIYYLSKYLFFHSFHFQFELSVHNKQGDLDGKEDTVTGM
jgi:hypothetical protein